MPVIDAVSIAFRPLDLHLRENETPTSELMVALADRRTAAIEPPIPQGKHEYVRDPEFSAGKQKRHRRLLVCRDRRYQEKHRSDQGERDHAVAEDAEYMIKRV